MKVCFSGMEHAVEVDRRWVSVLQIESPVLFARVCQSVLSGKGEEALEPYTIWDDAGNAVNPTTAFFPVVNLFSLPWKHRKFFSGLYAKALQLIHEDEELWMRIEGLGSELGSAVAELGFQMRGDYGFEVEWDLVAYLKAFGFNVEVSEDAPLFDNLIGFVDYVADICPEEVLLFVNLRIFLSADEIESFYEHVLFLGIRMLMLESGVSRSALWGERKLLVDQDLLEALLIGQSDRLPSTQGRIYSNGFGAVTF